MALGKTQMVLVDKNDRVLGFKEKFATHKIPVPLHRAISVVIFNKDKSQMIITKRAFKKPTWPYFWTNAVCSHPYPGETYLTAARRRLYEELGFRTPIKEVFNFTYEAKMDNKIWGEHELDHTFIGKYEGPVHPDLNEVAGYEWIGIGDLKKDLRRNPKKYSPWFKIIFKKLKI
jgi:isopentenyl-diphosphate delta-isomerase